MLKRFKWTLIFSVVVIGMVVYPNIILLTNLPIDPGEQTQLNFIAITVVEAVLIFNTVFNIVSEWYRLHPTHSKSIEDYRENNPDIPDKYFANANVGGEGGKGGAPGGEGGEGGAGKGVGGHGGKGGKGGHG